MREPGDLSTLLCPARLARDLQHRHLLTTPREDPLVDFPPGDALGDGGGRDSRLVSLRMALSLVQIFLVLTVGPLALLTMKAHLQVNFIDPDNISELVSQQQANRDIRDMVKMVDRLAAETGKYEDFVIASEDEVEWPFPWYFRRYKNYRVKTADSTAMVQFGDDSTFLEMRAKLGDKYTYRKYLHRGAWIENSMGSNDLPGGTDLSDNIAAYWKDDKFKGKSFRLLFNNYFFHRERWSDINPKWGYAYFRKEVDAHLGADRGSRRHARSASTHRSRSDLGQPQGKRTKVCPPAPNESG